MKSIPENQPPEKPHDERLEAEASRRADQKAKDFDLLACAPFKDFEFNGEEEIHIHGRRGREIVIAIEQLNFDIRRFLKDQLPAKIAERLRKKILSDILPEIDVTRLED